MLRAKVALSILLSIVVSVFTFLYGSSRNAAVNKVSQYHSHWRASGPNLVVTNSHSSGASPTAWMCMSSSSSSISSSSINGGKDTRIRSSSSSINGGRDTRIRSSSSSVEINISGSDSTTEDENMTPSEKGGGFSFADEFAKPLPNWAEEERKREQVLFEELQEKRERIRAEFERKFTVAEETKRNESSEKWREIEEYKEFLNSQPGDEDSSTKKEWRKFWKREQEDTGFSLPGLLEVFPELESVLQWPTWARNRRGNVVMCKKDEDCQFPQACCPHPILPGEKFRCTGWGQRVLVPQYCPQEIVSEQGPRGEEGVNDLIPKKKKKNWEWDEDV